MNEPQKPARNAAEASRRALIGRYWESIGTPHDASSELYHDDAVLEFPQSQERFEGRENFVAWRKQYPANVEFQVKRVVGESELWVVEVMLRYDGGPWNYGCSLLEFRGDRVAQERIYWGEAWEAPDWRAPWRAAWLEEAS